MSYSGSKAQAGKGTTLSIGTTPTLVGEVLKLDQSARKNQTISTTNLDSVSEEFIGALPDQGGWDFEVNRVGGDAGQIAMETAFASGALTAFTVQLPKTPTQTVAGDKYAFNAIVEELTYGGFGPKTVITGKGKLKVSGALTYTPGS